MDKKSEEYLRQYIKLTDTIKQKIEAHAARYHIKAEIKVLRKFMGIKSM